MFLLYSVTASKAITLGKIQNLFFVSLNSMFQAQDIEWRIILWIIFSFELQLLFRKYLLPDFHWRIFFVSRTMAEMIGQCQNLINPRKGGSPWKFPSASPIFTITRGWMSKKKYVTELWIHPQQISIPFQWHRVIIHHIRGHFGIHVHSIRWN